MKAKKLRGLKKWIAALCPVQKALPCVGVVVFGGCLTFLVAPDELPTVPGFSDGSRETLPMIVLDAGHGGRDGGGRGKGILEKDVTLDVALRTERLLKMAGFPITQTRRDDTYVSLKERARIANEHDDALFISIHFNKDSSSSSSGIETYYAKKKTPLEAEWTWVGFFSQPEVEASDTGEHLAGSLQAAMSMRTEARNRGIRASNLYVVRHTRCPAVLVEGGFMTNSMDAQLLKNEDYRERLAMGIAEGIMAYQKARRSAPAPDAPRIAQLNR